MSDLPGDRPQNGGDDDQNPQAGDLDEEEALDPGDDQSEDDDLDAEPEPQSGAQPQQRGRARGISNGQRIRDYEARISDLDRTVQQLLSERNAPRPPSQAEIAEQQRVERERFEQMTPYEQLIYQREQTARMVQQAIGQATQPMREQNDRMEYDQLLRETPAYRRFDTQVADLKRQAPDVPRRLLLATAIGMRAMEQGGAATTRQRNRAADANGRQATRPSQSRGDVPSDRSRSGQTAADRLRDVKI